MYRRLLAATAYGFALLVLLAVAGCATAEKNAQSAYQVFAIRAVAQEQPVNYCVAAPTVAAGLACYDAALKRPPSPPPGVDALPTMGQPVVNVSCKAVPTLATGAPTLAFEVPCEDAVRKSPRSPRPLLWLKRDGEVTRDMVTDARASTTIDGTPKVDFSLSPEGAKQFAALTQANIGHQIAVVVNGRVVSTPVVKSAIVGGKCGSSGEIQGPFDEAGARAMANAIKPSKAHRFQPSPGTEAALSRFIEAKQGGEANYEDMTPELATVDRKYSSTTVPQVQSYGGLKSITFKTVDNQCRNVFEANFDKRNVEFLIAPLTPEGKIGFITWRALPTPEQEAAIKQRIAAGLPDPQRKAVLLEEIAGEQTGAIKSELMTPALLAAVTPRWPTIQQNNEKFGRFQDLTFDHVDQRGYDVYWATYQYGRALYRVGPLTADHKLQGLSWGTLASSPPPIR